MNNDIMARSFFFPTPPRETITEISSYPSLPCNLQRASTFVLNVLLQRAMLSTTDSSSTTTAADTGRATSALEEYGAAAITLELISSTALFLAREPFRVALARSRVSNKTVSGMAGGEVGGDIERREAYRQRFVNTAWLSAPVGLAFAAVVRLVYPWIIGNQAFVGIEENRQVCRGASKPFIEFSRSSECLVLT